MMKIKLLITLIVVPFFGYSQAPEEFKYQSIARDLAGEVLANSNIGIRMSVHDLSATGTIVFQETHSVMTNDFGLFTLSIGAGTPVIGSLGGVDWANGAKFVEVEGDLTGGVSYVSFGTSQLLSVPYALYAKEAGLALLPNGTEVGNTTYWDGSQWVLDNGNIFNNGANIGIGESAPIVKLDIRGNVNLKADSAYMIDGFKILWNQGDRNLFAGKNAGYLNSIGFANVIIGHDAGLVNTVGSQNTFVGSETGVTNLDGMMNSFYGRRAGYSNLNGDENTMIGAYAGQSTTSGNHNSFLGVTTGNNNTIGEENTFLGAHAGYFNNDGSFNTFVGNFAADQNEDGSYNTIIGFEADVFSGSYTNANAFGYEAIATSSNSVIIGNTSVLTIGGQVGWSTFSDKRLKTDIQKNEIGLNFINKLETVNYSYTAKGQEGITYTGLIAQDVERIMEEMNIDFSGLVRPKNEDDFYSIRYAEFVVPLIKSVQEQSEQIDDLKKENHELQERLKALESAIYDK